MRCRRSTTLVRVCVRANPAQADHSCRKLTRCLRSGILSPFLQSTLESNLPKASKKKKVVLGIWEKNLAGSIKAQFEGVQCETGETNAVVSDLLRGLRQHGDKLVKQLQPGDLERSVLGLGHAYSRAKVKFSVAKHDNHIIQAIATLDQIDKDLNQFTMRLRENYVSKPRRPVPIHTDFNTGLALPRA